MQWLLVMLFASAVSLEAQTSGGFNYTVSNGKATITGYSGSGGAVAIPSSLNGYPVVAVAGSDLIDGAFNGKSGISSLAIPSSVTNMQALAFLNCSSLTNFSVDSGSTSFTAFGGVLFDRNQTTLIAYPAGRTGGFVMSNSATSIGSYAFYGSLVSSVVLSNSVGTIGSYGFARSFNLTNISLGSGVWKIGDWAFLTCPSLTSIVIPDSTVLIGSGVFYSSGVTNISLPSKFWTNLAGIGVHPNAILSAVKVGDLSYTYQTTRTNGVNLVLTNPNSYQLFSSNQILDMKFGGIVLAMTNNQLTLSYQVLQSSNLLDWTSYKNESLVLSNTPSGKMFLRLTPNQ
jgi:hypothetical protein